MLLFILCHHLHLHKTNKIHLLIYTFYLCNKHKYFA